MRADVLAMAITSITLGILALVAVLVDSNFNHIRKTEWTCVQPYGAPEHECRQWVRTVQRKVAY